MKNRFSVLKNTISVFSAVLSFAILLILANDLFSQGTGASQRCGGFFGGNNATCPTACRNVPGGSCTGLTSGYTVCEAATFWGICANSGTNTCTGAQRASRCGEASGAGIEVVACNTTVPMCP